MSISLNYLWTTSYCLIALYSQLATVEDDLEEVFRSVHSFQYVLLSDIVIDGFSNLDSDDTECPNIQSYLRNMKVKTCWRDSWPFK